MKNFKKHAHKALFFLGGIAIVLLVQALIPASSNAATMAAENFDDSFIREDTTYVLALSDVLYRTDLTAPLNTVKLKMTDAEGKITYRAVEAGKVLSLTIGNPLSDTDMKVDFARDTSILNFEFLNARGDVLSQKLLVLVRSKATFLKAKLRLGEGETGGGGTRSHASAEVLAYRDTASTNIISVLINRDAANRDILTYDFRDIRDLTFRDELQVAGIALKYRDDATKRDITQTVKLTDWDKGRSLNIKKGLVTLTFLNKNGKTIPSIPALAFQFLSASDFAKNRGVAGYQYATLADALKDVLNLSLNLESTLAGYEALSLKSLMTSKDVELKIGTPAKAGEPLETQVLSVRNTFDARFGALLYNTQSVVDFMAQYRLENTYRMNVLALEVQDLRDTVDFIAANTSDTQLKEMLKVRPLADRFIVQRVKEEQKAYMAAKEALQLQLQLQRQQK